MLNRTACGLLLTALLASPVCQAANLQFMGRSVASEMTPSEVTDFKRSIAQALNEAPDLRTINWQSETSSRHGRVKIKYSYKNNDQECRKAIFDLRNEEQRRDFFHFDACKQDSGKWAVSETAATEFSKEEWSQLKAIFVDAIEHNRDGETAEWANNGNSASITPRSTLKNADSHCRVMDISLEDQSGDTAVGIYTFCKDEYQWRRQAP
ncbi:hypothetical protein [Gilvimarinus sp. DA14]|uniref:hypothetical protein n=1 Tax=Gilvimarinus sp. DA14 TaxID=2956798 RepID=UPI0020B6987C|nr:hypothetical protein [Gilvimarinus sp. DA14]UTF61610.1 hypothetical protein NHM04_07430 [Gilvimarinus sp. DA14]